MLKSILTERGPAARDSKPVHGTVRRSPDFQCRQSRCSNDMGTLGRVENRNDRPTSVDRSTGQDGCRRSRRSTPEKYAH